MLKEVLVVEGKMDTVAIKRALEADTIETGGFTLAPYTLRQIEAAYKKRGIIILTDPDGAGERILPLSDAAAFPKRGRLLYLKRTLRRTMMWASSRLSLRRSWQR